MANRAKRKKIRTSRPVGVATRGGIPGPATATDLGARIRTGTLPFGQGGIHGGGDGWWEVRGTTSRADLSRLADVCSWCPIAVQLECGMARLVFDAIADALGGEQCGRYVGIALLANGSLLELAVAPAGGE